MDAEFLYKISHPYKEDEKIVNNFSKNKAVKKGLTTNDFYHGPPSKFDKRSNSNNVQLKLNVENVMNGNAVSQKYVTNEEKKQLFIERNVNMLKDNFNMLNKFENELFSEDVSEHNSNNGGNNVVSNTQQSSSCYNNNNVMFDDNNNNNNNSNSNNTLKDKDNKTNVKNMKDLSHVIKQNKTGRTPIMLNDNNYNYISTEASSKHKNIMNKEQQHKHLPVVSCNYRIGIRVNRWNNINNMQAVI
jgi:hypothetical protein